METTPFSCAHCRMSEICLTYGLSEAECNEIEAILCTKRTYNKNDILYTENSKFETLFMVRSGIVKTFYNSGNKAGRISGYYIPGEMAGLDAIHSGKYQDTAIAQEVVSVCIVQFSDLLEFARKIPKLQKQIMRLMSEKIHFNKTEQERDTFAEKRVANFLLNLSTRLKRSGLPSIQFLLPMSKKDISEYLGIAFETMSRILSKMNENMVINLNKKEITLTDIRRLQEIACGFIE